MGCGTQTAGRSQPRLHEDEGSVVGATGPMVAWGQGWERSPDVFEDGSGRHAFVVQQCMEVEECLPVGI